MLLILLHVIHLIYLAGRRDDDRDHGYRPDDVSDPPPPPGLLPVQLALAAVARVGVGAVPRHPPPGYPVVGDVQQSLSVLQQSEGDRRRLLGARGGRRG